MKSIVSLPDYVKDYPLFSRIYNVHEDVGLLDIPKEMVESVEIFLGDREMAHWLKMRNRVDKRKKSFIFDDGLIGSAFLCLNLGKNTAAVECHQYDVVGYLCGQGRTFGDVKSAFNKARSARFEHGEKG